MSDRPIDAMDPFETRLAFDLRELSDRALRSLNAVDVAHELAAGGARRRLVRGSVPGGWLRSRPGARGFVAGLATAAVIIAVVGLGTILTRPAGVAADPSPSPSPSASASPPAPLGNMPAELQAQWGSVGPRPDNVFGGKTPVRATLGISIRQIKIDYYTTGSASLIGPDTIEIQLQSMAMWNCQAGDKGTYTFGLSSQGENLTMTPLSDACADRAAVLAGDWFHTDIGPLAAGDHVSGPFRPFGTSGQLSYAVPTGWEDRNECASCLTLGMVNGELMINLMAKVLPTSLASRCDDALAGAVSTPTGIATWLSTLPNIAVATPTSLALGGLSGVSVDVTVRPRSASLPCGFLNSDGGEVTLADPDAPDAQLDFSKYADTRVILLDRGDGQTLAVIIEAVPMGASQANLAEAMAIVQSFEFTR